MPKTITEESDGLPPSKAGNLVKTLRSALQWLTAGGDEIAMGARIPPRVRMFWGILVLAALAWLIALQHRVLDEVSALRTHRISDSLKKD